MHAIPRNRKEADMKNVVPITQNIAEPDVVRLAEDFLDAARTGDVIGAVLVCRHANGDTSSSGRGLANSPAMVGAIEQSKHKII